MGVRSTGGKMVRWGCWAGDGVPDRGWGSRQGWDSKHGWWGSRQGMMGYQTGDDGVSDKG